MKILIVTAWYHPFIHPRAHRWTVMAEHWARNGHEVQVLTARVRECAQHENRNGVRVHRVGFDSLKEWVYHQWGSQKARGRVGVKPSRQSLAGQIAAWIYTAVWKNLYFPDDACIWYFPARKKLRQLLKTEAFDAVITVSLPVTGHLLGLWIRRILGSAQAPFWLADIGDPFSFQLNPPNNRFLYQSKNRRLERQILETADAVTVTTPATLHAYEAQFGATAVARMSVIPPVLSVHQVPDHTVQAKRSKIKIGYFGALYAPVRTPDAWLDLLVRTLTWRPDLRGRLEVHFYGEIFPEFYDRLCEAPGIHLHGLCSREDAWTHMQQTDILLNIGNTTDFQLPSKAVEYLASGKPVLHLSYVANDPFTAIFGQGAPILALPVENGTVREDMMKPWLEWLESEKKPVNPSLLKERVAPFLLENVAKKYLSLISPASLQ